MATTVAVAGQATKNVGGTIMHAGNVTGVTDELALGRAVTETEAGQKISGDSDGIDAAISANALPGAVRGSQFLHGGDENTVGIGRANRDMIHDISQDRVDIVETQINASGTVGGVGDVVHTTIAGTSAFANAGGTVGSAADNEASVSRSQQGEFQVNEGKGADASPTLVNYRAKTG
jgi:hypothetical protein